MKLDNAKLSSISSTTDTAYTNLENQLYGVNKALTVLTKSLNFKGNGAEAQKSFMQSNSLNATYVLLQIGKEVKEYVEKVKKGFLEFESEDTGKVSSERVGSVKKALSTLSKTVSSDIDDLTSNEEKAAAYITVTATKTSKLTSGFTKLDTNLKTVNEDFKTKDDELSKGADTLLTSISNLDTMISQVLENYVTSSGKYNEAKFKDLTKEKWYQKGDFHVFDEKQKQDPYSYDTAYGAVGEFQLAKGWGKDNYIYNDLNLLSGNHENKNSEGQETLKLGGSVLSNKMEIVDGDLYKATINAKLLYAEADGTIGKNGIKLKAQAGVGEVEYKAGIFDDLFYYEGKTAAAEAKSEVALYSDEKESKIGVDFGVKGPKAEGGFGFKFFKNDQKQDQDAMVGIGLRGQVTEGASLTAMIETEKQYDNFLGQDWVDVHTANFKVGGSLFLGLEADITLPYLTLDF